MIIIDCTFLALQEVAIRSFGVLPFARDLRIKLWSDLVRSTININIIIILL